jgi:hypothetical protein
MSKLASLGVLFLGLALSACSSDSGKKGGSCTSSDQCWFVSSPANYDVASECPLTPGGAWSANTCNTADYTRKCTQPTTVDNKEVTYVYYWKASSAMACIGTEEKL